MKILFLVLPFVLLLGCKPEKEKNANDDNDKQDNVQRKDAPPEPDVYIAFREDPNGTIYLRDNDEDIDRLIVDLRPLEVEVDLLDRAYWRDNRCRQMSARKCVAGDCVAGNCEQVVLGGWTVCRCRL